MTTIAIILWAALALAAIFVYYVRYVEPHSFEVTRLELRFEDLPDALDGLTIAHLSDFHCQPTGGSEATSAEAVRLVGEVAADLVVITGDLLDGYDLLDDSGWQLDGMSAPLGVWAVLGNHDHYCFYASGLGKSPEPPMDEIKSSLRGRGIEVLSNEHRVIEVGGAKLALVGCDDAASGNDDLPAAMAGADESDLGLACAQPGRIRRSGGAARRPDSVRAHARGPASSAGNRFAVGAGLARPAAFGGPDAGGRAAVLREPRRGVGHPGSVHVSP